MTTEELLEELIIELKARFNTEPRQYEKLDFGILVKTLEKILTLFVANRISNDEIMSKHTLILKMFEYMKEISSINWLNENSEELTFID